MGFEVALKGHCAHKELTRVKLPLHTVEQKEPWTFTKPGMSGQPDPFCSEETKRLVSLGPLKEGTSVCLDHLIPAGRWKAQWGILPTSYWRVLVQRTLGCGR